MFWRLRAAIYNRRHQTQIVSSRASLKARYGLGVAIGPDTFVDSDVSIGDFSYVNRNSSVENATIGKYCSVSSGVYIGPFEHSIVARSQHPVAASGGPAVKRPVVTIGNDVLISLNVVVLAGVTVGDGAVIGAGAVVTRDVEAYSVVAGVPARKVRDRFSPEVADSLRRLAWWDWGREKVLRNVAFLSGASADIVE